MPEEAAYLSSRSAAVWLDVSVKTIDRLRKLGEIEGFKLTNVPLAAQFDSDFTAYVTAMENNWLEEVAEAGTQQAGAFRPGIYRW